MLKHFDTPQEISFANALTSKEQTPSGEDEYEKHEREYRQQRIDIARYYLKKALQQGGNQVDKMHEVYFALQYFCNPQGLKTLGISEKEFTEMFRGYGLRVMHERQTTAGASEGNSLQQYQYLQSSYTAMRMLGQINCHVNDATYAAQMTGNTVTIENIWAQQEKIFPLTQKDAIKALEEFDLAENKNMGIEQIRRLMELYEIAIKGFQPDPNGEIAAEKGIVTSDPGRLHVLYSELLDKLHERIKAEDNVSLTSPSPS